MTSRVVVLFLALLVIAPIGCGSDPEPTAKTVTVTRTVDRADSMSAAREPADAAPTGGPREARYVSCDANIRAREQTTTCEFAQNAFYAYWDSGNASRIRVYSPATETTYTAKCQRVDGYVICKTSDGGQVKFPQRAVDLYTADQASAYADTHDVGPSGATAGSDDNSPYEDYESADSYDSAPSVDDSYDYDEPSTDADFCDTHDCIDNYPNGRGDTVQCADGSYSQSGGIQGACSHHGGVR